jgi:rod shape-determining protein MreD
MNYFSFIFVLITAFLAVFAQSWLGIFRDWIGAQVDLLPVLIVYASLTMGIYHTAALAVVGGLWFDSMSSNPLGVSILPLFLVGLIIYECRDLLLRSNAFAQIIIGASASAVCPCLTLFLILNIGHNPLVGWRSLWQLMVMVVSGGLLTPIVFSLFNWVNRTLNYQPVVETSFRMDRQMKRGRN